MSATLATLLGQLNGINVALKAADIQRGKSPDNQQGMPFHLYEVSQMYSAIRKQLGLAGVEGTFHALKRDVERLEKEARDDSKEWTARLEGRSPSRSRTRSTRRRIRSA